MQLLKEYCFNFSLYYTICILYIYIYIYIYKIYKLQDKYINK